MLLCCPFARTIRLSENERIYNCTAFHSSYLITRVITVGGRTGTDRTCLLFVSNSEWGKVARCSFCRHGRHEVQSQCARHGVTTYRHRIDSFTRLHLSFNGRIHEWRVVKKRNSASFTHTHTGDLQNNSYIVELRSVVSCDRSSTIVGISHRCRSKRSTDGLSGRAATTERSSIDPRAWPWTYNLWPPVVDRSKISITGKSSIS